MSEHFPLNTLLLLFLGQERLNGCGNTCIPSERSYILRTDERDYVDLVLESE
jgi:hypothetical protein